MCPGSNKLGVFLDETSSSGILFAVVTFMRHRRGIVGKESGRLAGRVPEAEQPLPATSKGRHSLLHGMQHGAPQELLQPCGTPAFRKIASELSSPAFAAASGVMSFVRPKTSTLSASL
jgi:hypothetical protein